MSFDVNNECEECGYVGDACECEFDAFKAKALHGNGLNRRVHVADDSESNAKRFYVFAFGAYASTLVAVGYAPGYYRDKSLTLDDALEIAADHLHGAGLHGLFYVPDFVAARADMLQDGTLSADEGEDLDSDEVSDRVYEYATADLTYTESGYLLSHEWAIISENATRAEVLEMAGHE